MYVFHISFLISLLLVFLDNVLTCSQARKLAEFKAKAEEDTVAALKKLEAEKWVKIADKFKATGSEYTSLGLQKKWELMTKKGEVTAAGEYVGDDVAEPEVAEGAEAEAADTEMKENGDVDVENEDGSEADADAEADNEET